MRRALQAAGIAAALLACGAAQAQSFRRFAYDSSRPLQVREARSTASDGVRVVELSYASPKGGRVPATLVLPAAEGRYPAVVFQHGAGAADRSDFLAEAEDLARAGLASLLVDAPFNRPPYRPWLTFRERDRAAYVQNVIDLRRALDLLRERPEIDGDRLALAGFSYGGVLAGIVAGVERRLDAVVVMSGPGRVTDALREEGRRLGVAPKRLRRYLAYMRVVDAVGYVGRATAPILFQFGRQDWMPAAWFRKYVDAAGPHKRVQWYSAGHGLDGSATRDRKAWLLDRLRVPSRMLAGAPESSRERIEPRGRTACARGGRYAFWLRRADPKRVVVFFQGGGGCFDGRSCAPGSTWFDDRVDEFDDPALDGGILAVDDSRNPFRNWSFLFVPSCTGDVHVGDRIARYGPTIIHNRGWPNARAALARAFGAFPDPDVVLVTGCSAGSVGSAFHVPAVIERWPQARVTQLGDSLAFVFATSPDNALARA